MTDTKNALDAFIRLYDSLADTKVKYYSDDLSLIRTALQEVDGVKAENRELLGQAVKNGREITRLKAELAACHEHMATIEQQAALEKYERSAYADTTKETIK